MTADPTKPPLMQAILADQYAALPPALKLHYDMRAHSSDTRVCRGDLKISHHPLMKLFAPLFKWLGAPPIKRGERVPTVARFKSPDGRIHFYRDFSFEDGTSHHFHSAIEHVGGREVIERMDFNIGWHFEYRLEGNRLAFDHKGFKLWALGRWWPLPSTWIIGRFFAFEEADSASSYVMVAGIRHWLLGVTYVYEGRFAFDDTDTAL